MKVCFCVEGRHGCWAKKGMANYEVFRKDFIEEVLEMNNEKIYAVFPRK